MSNPVMAVKTLTVKAWEDRECDECGGVFDEERDDARMAPGVPLVVAEDEKPYAVLDQGKMVTCPHCKHRQNSKGIVNQKWKNKKVSLHLLVHPEWLAGSPNAALNGIEYGGSVTDSLESTIAWNQERASKIKLIEVRGTLPNEIICPDTNIPINTKQGTIPKKSHFECHGCGKQQDVLETARTYQKTLPFSAFCIQGYCQDCEALEIPYGGRFFIPASQSNIFDIPEQEWANRKKCDLAQWYPESELPYGLEADFWGVRDHGYTHWWKMFNSRQLLVHSQLLSAIDKENSKKYSHEVKDFVLGVFQQYLRNQCMFTIWDITRDTLSPHLSKSNFRPKTIPIENSVFSKLGRGNWASCKEAALEGLSWMHEPFEIIAVKSLPSNLSQQIKSVSVRQPIGDVVNSGFVKANSATDLTYLGNKVFDLVITDPPFGDLLQYAELSDFFYVWLRLILRKKYPNLFDNPFTPKALEAVSNKARHAKESDEFYKNILTSCWRESNKILKPGGLLAFTFHHSEDAPWVAVLESLFDAGFYLEQTYPVRSDETKGDNAEFGSQKVEYDIVHVCRKRTEEPTSVSWGKMRREVLKSVQQLKEILEIHAESGLPAADLQVIKRGKALEYFSRHYGKVYVDGGKPISVKEALVGINQLLDEEGGSSKELPPVTGEPFTRQFLRIFDGISEQPRDQMQKYLRGTGMSPKEFEERGWCQEKKKVYYLTPPLEIAKNWQGKHRQKLTSDYDQAMFLIGACFDDSGIKVNDTLKNPNFRPHPALGALLSWHTKHGASKEIQTAALRALQIYQAWERQHPEQAKQLQLEFGE